MGTRSTIALEYADGTVEQVYCHWDGYLEHNGKILLEHYSDPFKLQQLLALGRLSQLKPEIGVKHPFDSPTWGTPEHEEYTAQFGKMCLVYARDRGEDLTIERYVDFENFTRCANFEEYNYILRNVNGKAVWFVATDDKFVELEKELEAVA